MYPKLKNSVLKMAESPFLYNYLEDEIYELDFEAFDLLKHFTGKNSLESITRDPSEEVKELIDFLASEGCIEDSHMKHSCDMFNVVENSKPSLRYLQMHITTKCNLDCAHCYLGKKSGIDMEKKLAFKIIDEFSEVGWKLLITGGEPFLSSHFWDILKYASKKPLRIEVFTNGTLLTEGMAEKLGKYAHMVQISLDGIETGHEILRGRGTFKSTIKGIENARKYVEVSIATMIHSYNLKEFPELSELIEELDIEGWSLDVPSSKGNLEFRQELIPDYKEAARIYSSYGFSNEMHLGSENFACGSHLMSVSVDGNITKCGFFDRSLGRIGKISLMEGWKKVIENFVPDLQELECRECINLRECRGGCRYRAELSGDFLAKDPFMCTLLE